MRVHSLSLPASSLPAPNPESTPEARYRELADQYQKEMDTLEPQLAELKVRYQRGHKVALGGIVGLGTGFGVLVAGSLIGGGSNALTTALALPVVAGGLGAFGWGIWTRDTAEADSWFKRADLEGATRGRDLFLQAAEREHSIGEIRAQLGEPVQASGPGGGLLLGDKRSGTLFVLNESGQERLHLELPAGTASLLGTDAFLYVLGNDHALRTLHPEDGRAGYTVQFQDVLEGPKVDHGAIRVVDKPEGNERISRIEDNARTVSFDPKTGQQTLSWNDYTIAQNGSTIRIDGPG